MVEAQGVHHLVEGAPHVAQAVALVGVGWTQGEVLASTAAPHVRPAAERGRNSFYFSFALIDDVMSIGYERGKRGMQQTDTHTLAIGTEEKWGKLVTCLGSCR